MISAMEFDNNLSNIHYVRLAFPEIKNLPANIVEGDLHWKLKEVIVDQEELDRLISIIDDDQGMKVMTMDDVRSVIEDASGMSMEEFVEDVIRTKGGKN